MYVPRLSGKLRLLALALTLGLSLTLALPLTASAHTRHGNQGFFEQTNLVSDQSGVARHTDPNLVNSWGIVAVPEGPFWIADNGTGVATAYNGNGRTIHSLITIPPPAGSPAGTTAAPTGIVLNRADADDFEVSENGKSRAAQLLFATEDGTISGWNPKVDKTNAILAVDCSGAVTTPDCPFPNVVYKGLAQGKVGSRDFIYANDFRNGVVDMFDARFHLVKTFTDPQLASDCPIAGPPKQCFAPFGIRSIDGKLFVTFALQDDKHHDDVAGPGNGFVDVFDTSGNLVQPLIAHGPLDSPWGLAQAPDDFGPFSHALLVGNFGNKNGDEPSINAFDINTGTFLGSLNKDKQGHPIIIDGLWGLTFGDDVKAAESDDLYFTAGPNKETHGLFGFLSAED